MSELHKIGWKSFQDLCLMITRQVLGQTVETFLDSRDGGRDGAFRGTWCSDNSEDLVGQFVIQCKFTSRQNHSLRLSDITDELSKIRSLVERSMCDTYLLMTNMDISGPTAERVGAEIRNAGANQVRILGCNWIEQQIRENKRLRMMVPRVYGLGDLSQILDERAYAQARAVLESMREDLAKVVVTDAYRRSAHALDQHGFVLLVGEPAAGKTTIASMLAVAAADQWGASVLKLSDARQVVDRWNPDEPSQFFWIDDAFGVTQYQSSQVYSWNHTFPIISTMIRRGCKIVMASRDYIYNSARNDLKESAFPLLRESQVVIDVHDLSPQERQQILYNHLKMGRQPRGFLTRIKPNLDEIASNKHFVPETARRLADPLFTAKLSLDKNGLEAFVERRSQFLLELIRELDADSKAALALVFMRGGVLESPIEVQATERSALERLGSDVGGCTRALTSLAGSLVIRNRQNDELAWRFKHPTIGDGLASYMLESPEHISIYVKGTTPQKLLDQVTCGDVGLERALVLPASLFADMIRKLDELMELARNKSIKMSPWDASSAIDNFLSSRCSRRFLEAYIEAKPALIDQVSEPGLYLSAVSELPLAIRLYRFGLLPTHATEKFIATLREYAVSGEDTLALVDLDIRAIFGSDRFKQMVDDIREQLIPNLEDVRIREQEACTSHSTREDKLSGFMDAMANLKEYFQDEPAIVGPIEREVRLGHEWIEQVEDDQDEEERKPRELGSVNRLLDPTQDRSIFDDIDG